MDASELVIGLELELSFEDQSQAVRPMELEG